MQYSNFVGIAETAVGTGVPEKKPTVNSVKQGWAIVKGSIRVHWLYNG